MIDRFSESNQKSLSPGNPEEEVHIALMIMRAFLVEDELSTSGTKIGP